MNKFLKAFLLLNLSFLSSAHTVPEQEQDVSRVKVYDYGIPTLEELIKYRQGELNIIPKAKYLKYDNNSNIKFGMGKAATITKPFNFDIEIKDKSKEKKYSELFEQAADQISNKFEFTNTINVKAIVKDFCELIEGDLCKAYLGLTFNPVFVPLKLANSTTLNENANIEYSYPQALVKQLNINKKIQYSDIDFLMYINSNLIDNSADNNLVVITHEMIHGLGLFSNGVLKGDTEEEQLYFPNLNFDIDIEKVKKNEKGYMTLYGFLPFSVFNKYMVTLDAPTEYTFQDAGLNVLFNETLTKDFMNKINEEMNKTSALQTTSTETENGENINMEEVYLQLDDKTYKKLKKIGGKAIKESSLGFRTNSGKVIELQTFDGVFSSGSSISHIAVAEALKGKYVTKDVSKLGPDYLMNFTIQNFTTTEYLNAYPENNGLIGPQLIELLSTLGYTPKGQEKDTITTYEVTERKIPYIIEDVIELMEQSKELDSSTPTSGSSSFIFDNFFVGKSVFVLLFTVLVSMLF